MAIVNKEAQTVTLSVNEYKELIEDMITLRCLENGGVDNWEWRDDSLEEFDQMLEDELKRVDLG